MNNQINAIIGLTCIMLFGAGCLDQPKAPAKIIKQAAGIVPMEIASQAPDEPTNKTIMAMPCLKFKDRAGFLSWVNAYQEGTEPMAIDMAKNINLPEKADASLPNYLISSVPENTEFNGLCVIHKQLSLISWGAESKQNSDFYVYNNGHISKMSLEAKDTNKKIHCIPSTITDSEMIWKCDMIEGTWQQIHINRKSGEMKAIECEQKNPGLGCL